MVFVVEELVDGGDDARRERDKVLNDDLRVLTKICILSV